MVPFHTLQEAFVNGELEVVCSYFVVLVGFFVLECNPERGVPSSAVSVSSLEGKKKKDRRYGEIESWIIKIRSKSMGRVKKRVWGLNPAPVYNSLHVRFLALLRPPLPLDESRPFQPCSSIPTAVFTASSKTSSTPRISLLLHSTYIAPIR